MSRPKLLFLATEDWFVRSHFEHLLHRATEDGYDVVVAARMSGALQHVRGVRLVNLPIARSSPLSLWREAEAVRSMLRREQPAIVHAIALRPIATLLLMPALPSVFTVTGRGYLSLQRAPWARATLALVAAGLRRRIEGGAGVLLVENQSDLSWVRGNRSRLPEDRVLLMPGAGVDVSVYCPCPEPTGTIVVGVVGRFVYSKGIDLAVDAVSRLRNQGLDISLRLAGKSDSGNPYRVSDAEVMRWRSLPGVEVVGQVRDINAFWEQAHIACLPSRGGEGLPRSLLEAAACGRPIVTTATPGCGDFVSAGLGLVVKAGDPAALAHALRKLCEDRELRRRFGAAGRARVVEAYTLEHSAASASEAWTKLRCVAHDSRAT